MLWDDQVREWKEEAREAGLSEGRKEGRKEGIKEGREEGRAAGIAEGEKRGRLLGLEEGANSKAVETARNLLKMGLGSPEQISAATNLSIEEVMEIKQKFE